MVDVELRVFLNGKLVPKSAAAVGLDTVAFKYGAMVFEGIRAYWNPDQERLYVFRLADHARRLEESVKIMRMDTALRSADYTQAVIKTLRENAIRQHAHIRQMVYVD